MKQLSKDFNKISSQSKRITFNVWLEFMQQNNNRIAPTVEFEWTFPLYSHHICDAIS